MIINAIGELQRLLQEKGIGKSAREIQDLLNKIGGTETKEDGDLKKVSERMQKVEELERLLTNELRSGTDIEKRIKSVLKVTPKNVPKVKTNIDNMRTLMTAAFRVIAGLRQNFIQVRNYDQTFKNAINGAVSSLANAQIRSASQWLSRAAQAKVYENQALANIKRVERRLAEIEKAITKETAIAAYLKK